MSRFRFREKCNHRKGSTSISRAEQGMVSSKRVMTSGCRTPRRPTLFPRTKISAQRPGKKVGSEREKKKLILIYVSFFVLFL